MYYIELSIFQIISIGLFGFIFGGLETTTNMFYLLSKNYDLPKRQHGKELPSNPTEGQIYQKIIQMLSLGIFLMIISTISIVIGFPQLFVVGAAGIFVNGLIDYSKFRKKDMLIVWIIIAGVCMIFSVVPL